ncbi:MAG: hypothetical protein H7841_10680 [Magnetospirillum sp. WYHS-4]
MSDRTLAIRLAVKDGEVVRRPLMQLGEDGSKALSRIEQASKPASKGLLAINEVTSAARVHLEGFADHLGGVGFAMLRLGPAGLAAGAALGGLAAALGLGLREMETAQQSLLRLEAVLSRNAFLAAFRAELARFLRHGLRPDRWRGLEDEDDKGAPYVERLLAHPLLTTDP